MPDRGCEVIICWASVPWSPLWSPGVCVSSQPPGQWSTCWQSLTPANIAGLSWAVETGSFLVTLLGLKSVLMVAPTPFHISPNFEIQTFLDTKL